MRVPSIASGGPPVVVPCASFPVAGYLSSAGTSGARDNTESSQAPHLHAAAVAGTPALGLATDWRRLDERIEGLFDEIGALARHDKGCERLMTVPGIGPIVSSAMVAAIGTGGYLLAFLSVLALFVSTGTWFIRKLRGPHRSAFIENQARN
jgi:hypothetical protein